MNKTRRAVLTFTALVVAAMILMPPWHGQGYATIFDPPENGVIDFTRLVIQVIATSIVGSVAYLSGTDAPASARPR